MAYKVIAGSDIAIYNIPMSVERFQPEDLYYVGQQDSQIVAGRTYTVREMRCPQCSQPLPLEYELSTYIVLCDCGLYFKRMMNEIAIWRDFGSEKNVDASW